MEQFEAEAVVIGAGVVGLAVARALAHAGYDTIILEKNDRIGTETSARNSEVIHAGIYYPQGSLKARLCVRGKALLYEFCAAHRVPHKRVGKLIVAQAGQETPLAAVARAASDNGVEDLKPLEARDIAKLEPVVTAKVGLFSPTTGIIDSHQYMLALLGDLTLVKRAVVTSIHRRINGWSLSIKNNGDDTVLNARLVVNAAGLWAHSIAHQVEGLHDVPPLVLAKGNYASLSIESPFTHLIYPVPDPGGLGVHVTLDMKGGARFGPNVEWLSSDNPASIDYSVPQTIVAEFAPVIARYWPGIRQELLAPNYAGVRPKLSGPGEPNADFRIDGPATHGLPGLVNLFGIESPGLTASLAIAEYVMALLS